MCSGYINPLLELKAWPAEPTFQAGQFCSLKQKTWVSGKNFQMSRSYFLEILVISVMTEFGRKQYFSLVDCGMCRMRLECQLLSYRGEKFRGTTVEMLSDTVTLSSYKTKPEALSTKHYHQARNYDDIKLHLTGAVLSVNHLKFKRQKKTTF